MIAADYEGAESYAIVNQIDDELVWVELVPGAVPTGLSPISVQPSLSGLTFAPTESGFRMTSTHADVTLAAIA